MADLGLECKRLGLESLLFTAHSIVLVDHGREEQSRFQDSHQLKILDFPDSSWSGLSPASPPPVDKA